MNPDDPGAKKKFQKLQEAFEVLGNPEKRKLYDQYGSAFAQGGPQGSPFHWPRGGSGPGGAGGAQGPGGSEFDLDELLRMFGVDARGGAGFGSGQGPGGPFEGTESAHPFQQFFKMGMGEGMHAGAVPPRGESRGRQQQRRRPDAVKGTDLLHTITIPFEKAILGGKAEFVIRKPNQLAPETISFTIPAGVESGKKIRLRELGNPSATGGRPGDLIITIQVKEHSHYQRKGRDIYLVLPISLQEAVFGAKVDLPSPQGTVSLTIPPGSTSGMKLRAKGCGVPTPPITDASNADAPSGKSGDLIAELAVALPRQWSEQDLELLRQLQTTQSETLRKNIRWNA